MRSSRIGCSDLVLHAARRETSIPLIDTMLVSGFTNRLDAAARARQRKALPKAGQVIPIGVANELNGRIRVVEGTARSSHSQSRAVRVRGFRCGHLIETVGVRSVRRLPQPDSQGAERVPSEIGPRADRGSNGCGCLRRLEQRHSHAGGTYDFCARPDMCWRLSPFPAMHSLRSARGSLAHAGVLHNVRSGEHCRRQHADGFRSFCSGGGSG